MAQGLNASTSSLITEFDPPQDGGTETTAKGKLWNWHSLIHTHAHYKYRCK